MKIIPKKRKYKTRPDGRRETTKSYKEFGPSRYTGKKHFYGASDEEVDKKIADFEKALLSAPEPKSEPLEAIVDAWWEEKEPELSPNTVQSYKTKKNEIIDRFGDPPPSVNALIQVALLRGEASGAGITDIAQKGGAVRFVFADFDFQAVSALYARPEWSGRVKVEAGGKPAVAIRLVSKRRILDEARAFVRDYAGIKKEGEAS